MKKNNTRMPKPRGAPQSRPQSPILKGIAPPEAGERARSEERKIGVVSNTPADTLDEVSEHKGTKWIAIYISTLAVLLAIGATGSNDAMKAAQQAGFSVVDTYAFYQAKTIRQTNYRLASDALQLKKSEAATPENIPEAARKAIDANAAAYLAEIGRLESDGKAGRKELLVKAEDCENERALALAQHPFYDYSQAMLQIAIVLASASIVAGARALLGLSGLAGAIGIGLLLNGYILFYGGPAPKHAKTDELIKAGVTNVPKCSES